MAENNTELQSSSKRFLAMLALIIAGESIFFLPFVLVRVFRPTILAVFEIDNFELGTIFSVYGIIAMISYFFGGPLADKFATRSLLSIALAVTALGGLTMASIPSLENMKLLYAFWGATTILLFWAALIRATREWGSKKQQGRAFGLLDGGRGLAAAVISSLAVAIFAAFLPVEIEAASLVQKTEAFRFVILFVAIFTFCVAILVYFALPKGKVKDESGKFSTTGFRKIIRMPVVWLQSIIIVCAYVGYKTTDDFSLFASDILLFNEVKAASVGTIALWMRPIVAILAGLIADKISASKMTIISFLFMLIGSLTVGIGFIEPGLFWLFFSTIVTMSLGVYALRGLYFAIMEEGEIPLIYTGTAVGLISVIGYTPDIFMGPLMGYLLDNSPGSLGHQHVFLVLSVFSIIGLFAAIQFRRISAKTY